MSASSSRTSICCPRLTALENVMMPLAYAPHGLSPDRECRARAVTLLERVGLGERLDHEPTRSSPAASSSGWRSPGRWSTAARS